MDIKSKRSAERNGLKLFLFIFSVVLFAASFTTTVMFITRYSETMRADGFENSADHSRDVSYILTRIFDILNDETGEAGLRTEAEDKYYFYYSYSDQELANTDDISAEFFSGFPTYYILENGSFRWGEKAFPAIVYIIKHHSLVLAENDPTLYIAFTEDYTLKAERKWAASKAMSVLIITLALISGSLFIIVFCILSALTGTKSEGRTKICRFDILPSDLQLCLMAGLIYGAVLLMNLYFWLYPGWSSGYMFSNLTMERTVWFFVLLGGSAVYSAVFFPFLLSLIRKIKAGCVMQYSLIVGIPRFAVRRIKELFTLGTEADFALGLSRLHRRFFAALFSILLLFAATCVTVYITAFYPLYIILALLMICAFCVALWHMRTIKSLNQQMSVLVDQINRIYAGDFDFENAMPEDKILSESSKKLYNIREGLASSLEKQMRSERMKVDLIANVSHDLKTPLTSIISYSDLLYSDKSLPEEAREYAKILYLKAEKLKNNVTDIFDLSKITSGDMKVECEPLDMEKLIVQILVDMEDQFENSNIAVRTDYRAESPMIYADGKKLSRVFQNVFENALKYAMPKTRLFISLTEEDGLVRVSVQNTSSYEMDFDTKTIMDRFTRGGDGLLSEGSGLGLSIAKSFTEICGGRFLLSIDGDQFKVIIEFPHVQ